MCRYRRYHALYMTIAKIRILEGTTPEFAHDSCLSMHCSIPYQLTMYIDLNEISCLAGIITDQEPFPLVRIQSSLLLINIPFKIEEIY